MENEEVRKERRDYLGSHGVPLLWGGILEVGLPPSSPRMSLGARDIEVEKRPDVLCPPNFQV